MASVARALQTVLEMLRDRGVEAKLPHGHDDYVGGTCDVDVGGAWVAVRLGARPAAALRDVVASAADEPMRSKHWIIAVTSEPVPHNKAAALAAKCPVPLQVFNLKELAFNISTHRQVPQHTRASEEEVRAVMERHMLKSKVQLPLILRTDAMARYLGLRPGEEVRVERPSATAGVTAVYRYCV